MQGKRLPRGSLFCVGSRRDGSLPPGRFSGNRFHRFSGTVPGGVHAFRRGSAPAAKPSLRSGSHLSLFSGFRLSFTLIFSVLLFSSVISPGSYMQFTLRFIISFQISVVLWGPAAWFTLYFGFLSSVSVILWGLTATFTLHYSYLSCASVILWGLAARFTLCFSLLSSTSVILWGLAA